VNLLRNLLHRLYHANRDRGYIWVKSICDNDDHKKTHTIINELYWCIRYDISITNHLNTEIILRSSIYDTKRMPFWDDMIISAIEFHGI
jgi:hypothetical protein